MWNVQDISIQIAVAFLKQNRRNFTFKFVIIETIVLSLTKIKRLTIVHILLKP